jgi:effector-binding domain-containing protein
MDVHVAEAPQIPLAVVRRRARPSELSTVVPQGCGAVWTFLKSQNLRGGRNVAVYLDREIHVEVGVEMEGAFEEGNEVVRSATPAGLTATVAHFGPYGTLGAAHDAIHEYCTANGLQITGPRWEVYGHWQEEWNTHPERIRTDVFYQVAAR